MMHCRFKRLEDIVKYAEAFEVAIHDQGLLQNNEEAMGASEYNKRKTGKFNKCYATKDPADIVNI